MEKKNIEDSIKEGLIITVPLKVVNVKPPKASLDAIDIMKLAAGEIVGGALVKDYAVYKKWIKE